MYIGLQVKYPSFLSDFNETLIFSRLISEMYSDIKVCENSSSGSRVVLRRKEGQTDKHMVVLGISSLTEISLSVCRLSLSSCSSISLMFSSVPPPQADLDEAHLRRSPSQGETV